MAHSVELVNPPQQAAPTEPITGEAPCTGNTALNILPEESQAVQSLVEAYKAFSQMLKQMDSYPEDLAREFTEGIHHVQLCVGTVRFYHTLNQEYRQHGEQESSEVMTPAEKLHLLRQEQLMFTERTLFRHYPEPLEAVAGHLSTAWEAFLALTAMFPDQHVHDEFGRGIEQCEAVLNRLHLERLPEAAR